ncbi:MAG: hypothetical protein ABIQ61_09170 [Ornithinibacter sp.]
MSSPDLLDPRARMELDRLARRWGELPLARAQSRMPLLRAALATLARLAPHPHPPRLIAPEPRSNASSGPSGVAGSQEVEGGGGLDGGCAGPETETEIETEREPELASADEAEAEVLVVADLGPAVVLDQLAVLVWDAYAAGRGNGIPDLLTDLRRELG